jgi:DtxR family Mn-dependent transcriptional regulator
MVSENVEEYLEAIYRLIEKKERLTTTNIAKILGVSPPSVSEMLKKLDKKGYLKYEPYKEVVLKRKGLHLGRTILRKHRLIERFLDTLGFSKEKIHDEACKLEHSVSEELERIIEKKMEKPVYRKGIVNLHDLRPGQKGEIVSIETGFHAKRRLEDMGLTPGTRIRILRVAPFGGPIEISVRGSRLAIGRGMSRRIVVKVEE